MMIDQPDNTRATAYVDDGELHEGTWCTCFACGNPDATRIADAGFAWCRACSRLHPDIHGEYRRRVSNQFAKIFPSLREEPKVGRVEEPTIIRLLRDGLSEAPEPGVCVRKIVVMIDDDADRVAAKAWLDRHPSRPEPPPAAPVPSSEQAKSMAVVAERLERLIKLGYSTELSALTEERDRLRHSVTEQQGEIARLREELGKTERLSASEEYRSLREAHADRDAYRRECNNLRCELAKAQERNAELEHFKRQHEVECPRRETIRRLEEDNARLQKELRDARSLLNRWMGWSSSVQELPPDGLYELSLAAIEKPPTASAKESEDKCAKCAGSGRMWDNGDKCACDDCNGTGKTATVESGADVPRYLPAALPPGAKLKGGASVGGWILNTNLSGYHDGFGLNAVELSAIDWSTARTGAPISNEPLPQASATEQPTDRLAEMARRAGPLPTTFLAGSPLTNEQAPAPVGGGDAVPTVTLEWLAFERQRLVGQGLEVRGVGRPAYEKLLAAAERDIDTRRLVKEARDALEDARDALQRFTGEHDAREGKQ